MIKNEEYREFYGIFYDNMIEAENFVLEIINNISNINNAKYDINQNNDIIEYCISRIKSPNSMIEKLKKHGYEVSAKSSIENLSDGVAVRVICKFLNDVYFLINEIVKYSNLEITKVKDYIKNPKSNGYRSCHLLLKVETSNNIYIPVELQIRTISQDAWASLEHKMKYKKNIKNQSLIQNELKRCADEMASTDISMQTIFELIEQF